jgi:SAM-dependent methyltransferase
MRMKEYFDCLVKSAKKPGLFEPGEALFWDDPHISKCMLEAHLDPGHDAASRKPATIEETVRHLVASGLLKPGDRVLDLGCGPGLYAEKFRSAGLKVLGIDLSERSLEYARKHSPKMEPEIEYRRMNFFEMRFENEFDAVIQVYGELCVFPDEMRDKLLGLIRRALKPGGLFLFDVSTRELRRKVGLKNGWYASEDGFWRPGRHVVLEQGFDYPEENVWLDQYTVLYDSGCKVYRNWFHDYRLDELEKVLANASFEIRHEWNDLTGTSYKEGGDWIAVAARSKTIPG